MLFFLALGGLISGPGWVAPWRLFWPRRRNICPRTLNFLSPKAKYLSPNAELFGPETALFGYLENLVFDLFWPGGNPTCPKYGISLIYVFKIILIKQEKYKTDQMNERKEMNELVRSCAPTDRRASNLRGGRGLAPLPYCSRFLGTFCCKLEPTHNNLSQHTTTT